MESRLRIRMSDRDVHYGGNLVSAARCMELFGDAATELAIRDNEDEGLLAGYESVEFLAPIYGGDFIEIVGVVEREGNRSRRCRFEAYKVIASDPEAGDSKAVCLEEPVLVARAVGTFVLPKGSDHANGHKG